MNRLYDTTLFGTFGELLVQIRLLQFDVQAASPIKDSGNDLIAIRQSIFKAIQVKTTKQVRVDNPSSDKLYHILAIVHLPAGQDENLLDSYKVYLFSKEEVSGASTTINEANLISQSLINRLFAS